MVDRQRLFLFLAASALTLLAPLAALVAAVPVPGQPVLVIVPPWLDRAALVAAAGGQQVGPEMAPLAFLAAAQSPGFSDRLRQGGAWAVRDGAVLAKLCGAT